MNRTTLEKLSAGATFSPCGLYRYTLTRRWLLGSGSVLWILLNPSTADATLDDPTIRRGRGFAQDLGFASMTVANLFAIRATDPKVMLAHPSPVGPDNDRILIELANSHDMIIGGWGAHGPHLGRSQRVEDMIGRSRIHCLGLTKAGEPRHPLYMPKSARPVLMGDA